ncbi:hypothetical protein Taro_028569 [Colocasia esculenta]|uniref:Remorin C-terminal domain-containing protein n=1 Tax=Colocasia esculenta TaxID=4460 RepID=A0A843VSA1_COLES|nr:hypothetical protein [Colocasia esculenta]
MQPSTSRDEDGHRQRGRGSGYVLASAFLCCVGFWVQMGVISPSKLRMKLLGVQNHRRKESANNSSRTSPSRLEDLEYAKDSLLAHEEDESLKDSGDDSGRATTVANVEPQVINLPKKESDQNGIISKEKNDVADIRTENTSVGVLSRIHSGNSRTVHPVRSLAEESNGYDSGHDNGSASSFEFHRGERVLPSPVMGPFSRPVPSKWNDAEKWIINRQSVYPHTNVLKKTLMQQRQVNQKTISNLGKVAPESVTADQGGSSVQAADTKKIDSYHPQAVGLRFPFASFSSHPTSEPEQGISGPIDFSPNIVNTVVLSRTHKELNQKEIRVVENSGPHAPVPSVKSVCMRDMGTEMTPVASQEPSRTGTPNGAMTPILSPLSSRSSSPRRGAPAPSPFECTADVKPDHHENSNKTEVSENERRLKTRKEILALGLQLGKTNIAAWASKGDIEDQPTSHKVDMDQLKKVEFEARAAAWEEAEKTKHMARLKREEIKIQVWESHQKAKFEAQMREVEAQAEMMKARAQEKMVKQLSLVKQHSQDKLAASEARKSRDAARTTQQVEHIRRTGRAPPSHHFCCPWLS